MDKTALRDSLPYRDCAGIALFNAEGKVFIGRRSHTHDAEASAAHGHAWQMPQGGVDSGEAPLDAARRELFEETSITSAELIAEAPEWIFYDLPDDLLGVSWKGKYRGQRQRWFALHFTGDESEINVTAPGGGKFPAEFAEWRWEELSRTPSVIVEFKRAAYQQVVAAFADLPAKLRHA